MDLIVGNRALLDSIKSAVARNNLAGTYLIEGAEGTGKRSVAKYFAASLRCENKKESGEPCFSCRACRQILAEEHIDVMYLRPEDDKKTVSVKAARDFLKASYLSSTDSEWRVFIVENTEKLNSASQNALLKSIEEVRQGCLFLLLTSDSSRVLPTVRSRCVKWKTERLSAEEIRKELLRRGVPEDSAETAALLSRGSLGKALEVSSDPELAALRRRVLDYFSALFHGENFSSLCRIYSPSLRSREEADTLFLMTKLALRDLICQKESPGAEPEFFTDREFLRDLALISSREKAAFLFEKCDEFLLANEANVNLFSAVAAFNLSAQELTRNLSF